MIRWVWRMALAATMVIAIFAQLDRASYLRPELSVIVPRPFRSFAQSPTALLALAAGDRLDAQAEARRLVRRRPMPAEHLFTLALADLRNGDPQAFARAFRAASTRGWRFAPLQGAAAQAALQADDLSAAANRVAALWAADPGDVSVGPLTRSLLERPGGPQAFAVPLAHTRVWANSFLARAPAIVPRGTALQTVQAAQRLGARFDCATLQRFADQVAARGETMPPETRSCR